MIRRTATLGGPESPLARFPHVVVQDGEPAAATPARPALKPVDAPGAVPIAIPPAPVRTEAAAFPDVPVTTAAPPATA